ncbi:MAG: ATP-dependent helicase HrpB [Alteromonadaceae bacterium]|nr:MAG: ATP-dependent helicase HrpB [Alteromonadaceae bacterium]
MNTLPDACSKLPISEVLDTLKNALRQHPDVVLEAPPGAGKTTVVPLALLNEPWLGQQQILMLEPRRMAARSAAQRMASLLGESVGQTVGYQIRQESKHGPKTRILVITEGILTRKLQADPSLDGVGAVIFDEFHERHLDSDLGLALSLYGRALFRTEEQALKLIVMSATLDGLAISTFLQNAPVVRSEGRMYPVTLHYDTSSKQGTRQQQTAVQTRFDRAFIKKICTTIESASQKHKGSLLVFLPGQAEIRQVMRELPPLGEAVQVRPLYGGLSLKEQQLAIAPSQNGRKVVLATDIAETSLTIEGIDVVIDSGYAKRPVYDPNTAMTRLKMQRISQSSSTQRMGRAGRLAPGHCYRLWIETEQLQRPKHHSPEILNVDLSPLALQLLHWGVDDPAQLQWLDNPPKGAYASAISLLQSLGAIEKGSNSNLTPHGNKMAEIPAHPRISHMLLKSIDYRLERLAANLAAYFIERAPSNTSGADLQQTIDITTGRSKCSPQQQAWLARLRNQASTYINQLKKYKSSGSSKNNHTNTEIGEHDALGYLIACAYPDRIAQRRGNKENSYKLANGRAAALNDTDPLNNDSWLAIAESGGNNGQGQDKIFSAATFNPRLFNGPLASYLHKKNVALWDENRHRFIAENQRYCGQILFDSQTIKNIAPEIKSEALINLIIKHGLDFLPWTNELKQWQARVNILHILEPNKWPNVNRDSLLNTISTWLTPFLNDVNSLNDIKKIQLQSALYNMLTWQQQQDLNELVPTQYAVPSGSKITVDYSQKPPVLAVKLQEMFGCNETPAVAKQKVKLCVHLLSPARRPLQVTQDLAGFWKSSYHDVKKEMKGRYPKHPWPDDPTKAIATRFTKHRKPGGR